MVNQNNNQLSQPGFEQLFTNHDLTNENIYLKMFRIS